MTWHNMDRMEIRLQSQNIVHLLQNRESGYKNLRSTKYNLLTYEREFYKSITPCLSIQLLPVPPVYMRKFTPDGKLLLAFSTDQRSLHVFQYKGIGAARLNELQVGERECISGSNLSVFNKLFKSKFIIRLCQGDTLRYHLYREFSIFMDNGRYVLLSAMGSLTQSTIYLPTDYVRYPDHFDKLDHYSYIFYVVDLQLNCVSDKLHLPHDSICMSHNHGVSVYGHTITMLSRINQCIYVFELIDGKLIKQETIGPRPRGCTFGNIHEMGDINLNTKFPITHIKQRILGFLYRRINTSESSEYQKFYRNFDFIEQMILEKMQLVSEDLLLLRYEERPKAISDSSSNSSTGSGTGSGSRHQSEEATRRLYVFYVITSESILGVYDEDSTELLNIIRIFHDKLCNVRCMRFGDAPSSPTHNFIQEYFPRIPRKALLRQAALRFNQCIPLSTQSYSTSPYLNYNRLKYDDRVISPLERPKPCSNEPIVVLDRATNFIKFRIHAMARNNQRELCAFIFHPFEPLVLSIQKYNRVYEFNLHIYNHSTVVRQS